MRPSGRPFGGRGGAGAEARRPRSLVELQISASVLTSIDAQAGYQVTARGWVGIALILAGGCICAAEFVGIVVARRDRRTASRRHPETRPRDVDE